MSDCAAQETLRWIATLPYDDERNFGDLLVVQQALDGRCTRHEHDHQIVDALEAILRQCGERKSAAIRSGISIQRCIVEKA